MSSSQPVARSMSIASASKRARLLHRMPRHALRKRPSYHHRIGARRHEKDVLKRLETNPTPAVNVLLPHQLPFFSDEIPMPQSSPLVGVPAQRNNAFAEDVHDWILGGQDGIVNVLGSILGVAIVTSDRTIVLVAGIASLLSESISMAAVAYTSVRASHSYYHSERELQKKAIHENPALQKEILIDIYERKGLSRVDAHRIVTELIKDEEVWLETMMEAHLRMYAPEESGPAHSALVVGFAAIFGSLIPLLPFLFLPISSAIILTCIASLIALFVAGALTAKLTIGDWKARGLELMFIGGLAAAVSFGIGLLFTSGIIKLG